MNETKQPQTPVTYDADGLFEPIVIRLGGTIYIIRDITVDTLDKITTLALDVEKSQKDKKEKPSTKENINQVDKQLSLLLGAELKTLELIDVRKKCAVIKYLTDTLESQMTGKSMGNVGTGEKQSAR